MSDNTNPEMAGRGLSIVIALGLIFTGVAVVLLPLILRTVAETDAYAYARATYWFGMVMTLVGLSVLVARIIRIDAVGAGNMKFMGFELPIEVGGAMFVLFFLLLGGAAVTFGAGLHDIEEKFAEIEAAKEAQYQQILTDAESFARSHKVYTDLEGQLDTANSQVETLENQLAGMTGRRNALSAILQAGMRDGHGVELMRMRIDCGDRGKHWIDWPERRIGADEVTAILRPDPSVDVNPADVEPFRIYRGSMTYHLYPANSTGSNNRIISFNLRLDQDNVLTGTFESTGRSLEDFCQSFDPEVRDVAADPSLEDVDQHAVTSAAALPSETDLAADATADN